MTHGLPAPAHPAHGSTGLRICDLSSILDQTRPDEQAMATINIYEAKTRLSQLVEQAAAGDDVVIARNGKPVARLTRLGGGGGGVRFGALAGLIGVAEDFDAPLPADVLADFTGR